MADIELTVQPRTVTGKKVRFLRRTGITPANIYGKGQPSLAVQVGTHELQQVVRTAGHTRVVQLRVEGEPRQRPAILGLVQHDPVGQKLLHVDFHQVDLKQLLTAEIPIVFAGEAPAVKRGSMLLPGISTLQVEALPGELPEEIQVDVSGLEEADQAVHVRELTVPAGVRVLSDPDALVVKVEPPRVAVEEEAAEEAAEEAEEE